MFYETERMVRKQQKYEKSMAYDIIDMFKKKGLNNRETLACIEVMSYLDNQHTESQMASITLAHKITTYYINQESVDADSLISVNNPTELDILSARKES